MKIALSTNWNNRRLDSGEAIVDEVLALGFDALELGFNTTEPQLAGFRRRLSEMPVGSIHAFCPVPVSAPYGSPELYAFASPNAETYRIAKFHLERNIELAASLGADAVVLHAGRVMCDTWFRRNRVTRRVKRGAERLALVRSRFDLLVPVLERNRVRLGLENLPYLEGFPDETEMVQLAGDWIRPWFDLGHDYVRRQEGWARPVAAADRTPETAKKLVPLGVHIHDSNGGDDHLAPGDGKIDFAAARETLRAAGHLVFEPNGSVPADRLKEALAFIRSLLAGS